MPITLRAGLIAVAAGALLFVTGSFVLAPVIMPYQTEARMSPCRNIVDEMDAPSRRAFRWGLAWRLVPAWRYDSMIVECPTLYEVHLSPSECRGLRGGGSRCDGYIVTVTRDSHDVSVERYSGGK